MSCFSVIAIFKNESHILDEWITHYLNQGASQILLTDNNSNDNWRAKLRPSYLDDDRIKFFEDKRFKPQVRSYNERINSVTSEWALIVDLDEFMYAKHDFKTLDQYLNTIPSGVSVIKVPWKLFGSSGFIKQPDKVVSNFVERLQNPPEGARTMGKYFVRKSMVNKLYLHFADIKAGEVINCNGSSEVFNNLWLYVTEQLLDTAPVNLNHYWTQSRDQFMHVKIRRGGGHSRKTLTGKRGAFVRNFSKRDYKGVIDPELKSI